MAQADYSGDCFTPHVETPKPSVTTAEPRSLTATRVIVPKGWGKGEGLVKLSAHRHYCSITIP